MLHLKSCTFDRTTHTSNKLKSSMVQHHSCPDSEGDHKLLCPLTFTLIKDPTPLLNFFPLIASLCEGGICGMGRSLCSVLKESGKYSEKQTSIVSARHDIDIGLTCNGQ